MKSAALVCTGACEEGPITCKGLFEEIQDGWVHLLELIPFDLLRGLRKQRLFLLLCKNEVPEDRL